MFWRPSATSSFTSERFFGGNSRVRRYLGIFCQGVLRDLVINYDLFVPVNFVEFLRCHVVVESGVVTLVVGLDKISGSEGCLACFCHAACRNAGPDLCRRAGLRDLLRVQGPSHRVPGGDGGAVPAPGTLSQWKAGAQCASELYSKASEFCVKLQQPFLDLHASLPRTGVFLISSPAFIRALW